MKRDKVKITTPYIQLQQILKFTGVTETGGHAKEIIEAGSVLVNGAVCRMRGKKLYPGDIVQLGELELEVVS